MMSGTKRVVAFSGVLLAGSILSGCMGSGTTYGTGVSQEQQTLEDLSNILTLRKKKTNINYQSRPDLIVPDQKVLVEPQEEGTSTSQTDWPVSPEQRLARIRDEADAAQESTAAANNFARSQKNFRNVQTESTGAVFAAYGEGVPNVTCDPTEETAYMRKCTGAEISKAVRAERAEIRTVGKTSYSRRYLTEPPIEYRTPSNSAPIGDEGYSLAELSRIAKEKKERAKENEAFENR